MLAVIGFMTGVGAANTDFGLAVLSNSAYNVAFTGLCKCNLPLDSEFRFQTQTKTIIAHFIQIKEQKNNTNLLKSLFEVQLTTELNQTNHKKVSY